MNTIKNQITLIGNIGNQPEVTLFENGAKIARFNLATNENNKDKKSTEWHKLFAWGNIADFIENFGKKGKKIAISGRLVNRTYLNKNGNAKKTTEIEIRHIIGL